MFNFLHNLIVTKFDIGRPALNSVSLARIVEVYSVLYTKLTSNVVLYPSKRAYRTKLGTTYNACVLLNSNLLLA
jgi:hypothetical protein